MKHIKPIALAASIMALRSGNAAAEEIDVKSPDISGKLNTMVEDKMDVLVEKTYENRESVHDVELINSKILLIPGSYEKDTGPDPKKVGS